jgi:hypothetical protein
MSSARIIRGKYGEQDWLGKIAAYTFATTYDRILVEEN